MRTFSRIAVLGLILTVAACAHVYTTSTGLPADVQRGFFFNVDQEAQARGFQTARNQDSLTVYAPQGRIAYTISGDEIVATLTVPNKGGVNGNYYRQKREALEDLSQGLIEGARRRAKTAKDFAY